MSKTAIHEGACIIEQRRLLKHISIFARYVSIMQKGKHYGENNELVECWLSSDTTWDSCVCGD